MGDRVEILTQNSATPSRDWLKLVKTPSARSKIRSYFSKVSRSDDRRQGAKSNPREMRKARLRHCERANSVRALKQVANIWATRTPTICS